MGEIYTLYLLIAVLWISVISFLHWTLIDSINITFLVGIISLAVGVGIRINRTGFLDFLMIGFRRLAEIIHVKPRIMKQVDDQAKNDKTLQMFKSKVGKWLDITVFSLAYASLAISIGGLIFYYM